MGINSSNSEKPPERLALPISLAWENIKAVVFQLLQHFSIFCFFLQQYQFQDDLLLHEQELV